MNNQLRNEPATPAPVEGEFIAEADAEISRIRGLQHEHGIKMSNVGRELGELQQSLATLTDVAEVQKIQSRINALISVLNVLTVEEARLQKLFDEASEKRRSVDAAREFYSQTLRRKEIELQGVDASEYQAEEALAAVRRARPQLLAEIKQIKDLLISYGKATGFAHSFNPNDAPLSVIMPVIR